VSAITRAVLGLAAVAALAACATPTRAARYGPLAGGESLVTLVVTEDRTEVARQCEGTIATGMVLGCQQSWPVALPDGRRARSVKIVRYTDSLPSALAFEIDVHELCHAVAALQLIDDPCHATNGGVVTFHAAFTNF
jgi:hypothetical protein